MNKLVSFFMAVLFSVMTLLGIPVTPRDLEPTEGNNAKATAEQLELFEYIFETETKWLASLQLENGALPMTYSKNGDLRMNPYFADFAALALLDNAEKYADNVKAYMDWHFAHLNTAEEDFNGLDGTIYDYVITMKDGKVVKETISEPDNADSYDTTDSYAATFLTVVYKYFLKTGDGDYLVANAKDLERITSVIFSNLQNGLTYAKPNHRVKYLMDNCEVYEGVIAAAGIFEEIVRSGKTEYADLQKDCAELAPEIKENINTELWNFVGNHYRAGITAYVNIPTKIFSWDLYYPQATSQLFPVICGVIEPDTERAEHLYNKFCESFEWESFDYPDDFYWGSNVLAAAKMNDIDRVTTYMTNYAELMDDHAWPLYNADAARTSMAAYVMLERTGR